MRTTCILLLGQVFWLLFCSLTASGYGGSDEYILNNLLFTYDVRSRPGSNGPPVMIYIKIEVVSFHSVSESNMDWSVMIHFTQSWNDPRLSHKANKTLTVIGATIDSIWVPDTFFKNAKKVELHASPKKNTMMRIRRNGDIEYSVRLSLRSSCHMDLHNFPFDHQECSEKVSSYAYTIDDIVVKWSESPILVNEGVRLPQYLLSEWVKKEGQEETASENYSYVEMSFRLNRELGFYLLQVYIPSAALVIIAWLTLWIDASVSSPARASLGITTILALVTQSSWLRSEIPKVAYVTALDVWLATCQLLVFLILLQFTFIYYLNKLSGRRDISGQTTRKRRNEDCDRRYALDLNIDSVEAPSDNIPSMTRRNGQPQQGSQLRQDSTYRRMLPKRRAIYSKIARQTDKFSRVVFLGIFLVFNFIYWPTYTIFAPSTLK